MTFLQRPSGYTLRRQLAGPPAPADERFDDQFPVAMCCQDCGRRGIAPRQHIQAALAEHRTTCPARFKSEEHVTRLWYPGSSEI